MMKRKKVKVHASLGAHIIGNGSMVGSVRDGVNIPVLIIDAGTVPGISEAIESAKYEPDGDVKTVWAEDRRSHNPLLHVVFLRPTPTEFVVIFNMPHEGILVDGVLEAKAFYLKAGKRGDTFKSTFNDASILVDVPPSEFNASWPARYQASMIADLRKRGLGRVEARAAAAEAYAKIRQFTTFRMPTSASPAPAKGAGEQ